MTKRDSMTKRDFDAAVDQLLVRFAGSVTSGRRTPKHTLVVGGFKGDPHTWGLGVDVVWDTTWTDDQFTHLCEVAEVVGLRMIKEHVHTHIQPLDFPSGPVTSYGGVTQA